MELALREAERCLAAGEFPVGCVIVYQGRLVATGRRVNSAGAGNELDHAEMVALRRVSSSEAASNLAEVTVYSTMEPCLMCYSTLLVNGVRRFVYAYEDAMGGGTNLPLTQLAPLYRDLQPTVIGAVLRRPSLALFKQFFSSPDCTYLAGSLLADYTLAQEDNEQPPSAIIPAPGKS
jgi:tRNA(adenine34) deaminase